MENSERQSDTRASGGSPGATIARAPRGAALSCKGWQQEAALRMLMNSADPDVAEQSEQLIVSQDLGRVAADWDALRATVDALRSLHNDETLLVHDGKPIRTVRTRETAPRVLIVDSDPAANWTYIGSQSFLAITFELFASAARKYFDGSLAGKLVVTEGLDSTVTAASPLAATMNGAAFLGIDQHAERIKRRVKAGYCDVMVNNLDEALRILKNAVRKREAASVGLAANPFDAIPELSRRGVVPDLLMLATGAGGDADDCVPQGMNAMDAAKLRETDVAEFCRRMIESVGAVGKAAQTLQKLGSIIVSFFSDNWATAARDGVPLSRSGTLVAPIPDLLAPMLTEGAAPIRWVALSGEPSDLRRADRLLLETFPHNENVRRWIASTQNRVRYEGLPARGCILRPAERSKFGVAINELVTRGEFKAPILIVRDRTDLECAASPLRSRDSLHAHPAGPPPDEGKVESLLDLTAEAAWASFQGDAANAPRLVAQAIVADGTNEVSARIEQVLSS